MKWLMFAVQVLPAVIQFIKMVEEAIPGNGNGEAKLRWVREMLESTQAITSETWPIVEMLIKSTVTAFNATGVFKKST